MSADLRTRATDRGKGRGGPGVIEEAQNLTIVGCDLIGTMCCVIPPASPVLNLGFADRVQAAMFYPMVTWPMIVMTETRNQVFSGSSSLSF